MWRWRDRVVHSGDPPSTSPLGVSWLKVPVSISIASCATSVARTGSAVQTATSPSAPLGNTRVPAPQVAGSLDGGGPGGMVGDGTVVLRLVGDRASDEGVEVHVGSSLGIGFEIHVLLGQPDCADAVADGVVQLREQRTTAVFEAVDHHEHPEGPGAIEGVLVQQGREVEELPDGSRCGQAQVPEVVVEVELGIGGPGRRRQATQAGNDPLAEPRDVRYCVGNPVAKGIEVDGLVEDGDHRAAGVEPRVLLDVPHERFRVGHFLLEAQLALTTGCHVHAPQVSVPGRRSDSLVGSPWYPGG